VTQQGKDSTRVPTWASAMERSLRRSLLRFLTGEREIRLTRAPASPDELRARFEEIESLGLYVHIPFCEQICPYCPYNKELYSAGLADGYAKALMREIDLYADIVADRPVTSFYVGGGTPTTMLHSGLAEIIGHVRRTFDVRCDIHMESHPNHLSSRNLQAIESLGVRHLSIGVEALSDRHLKTLCRTYSADQVKEAIARAVSHGFRCVNVDVMFALPGQTFREIEDSGHELVRMGVDQVAAYPLFVFPYTPMGRTHGARGHVIGQSLRRRRMLRILEDIFYGAGYERTSVWAFTRRGVPRYCSVTVPLYLGLGASGGSYLRDVFYMNTFGVAEYVRALEEGRMAIALSVGLTERMQRAGWLYWRIYETRFRRADYQNRFGEDIDVEYGRFLRLLRLLRLLEDDDEWIALSDRGAFWLHACEDLASIDYVSELWGAARRDLWPERVILA
jgi:coproporphyrinogen III oxidase-like Fe-S oxidoreductase